jgi:hypothetical protein
MPANMPEPDPVYVYFDINIGEQKGGQIVFELVGVLVL